MNYKKFYQTKENLYKLFFKVIAFSSLIFLIGILVVLTVESLNLFRYVKISEFLFSKNWYPTHHEEPEFGAFAIIVGSIVVTFGAIIVGLPLGIGSAMFINEIAPKKLQMFLKSVIEVISAIPSVIFGFFGLVIFAPFVQKIFNLPIGLCAFSASVILGIMSTPYICSIAEDALSAVPRSFREASFALGATRWQTLTQVVIPAAGSGLVTSIILGASRAIGETMVVLMVAGNAAIIPSSIFDPVRPITSTIAAEMGETVLGGTHYYALFALGLILFILTLIFNIIAEIIGRKFRLKLGLGR